MKDFPVFTTEHGVASLVLKEIPYQGAAYITLRDSLEPELLLEECLQFCKLCGAERVYATGHEILEKRPLYTAMWQMRCLKDRLPDTDAALWPVQDSTVSRWQALYNEKVVKLPNGAWMSQKDAEQMLQKGDGYFVHRGQQLLGIGRASGQTLDFLAAFQPGAGEDVVCALAHALTGDDAVLTVASTNEKAINLYQRLGFVKNQELSRWYVVAESEKK